MKRPLISVKERTPNAAELARSVQESGQDLTYVPGYSDKRMQVDEDLRRGRSPSVELPFRLHYVTVQKPNGRPDLQKATQFRANGYKPVPFDEAASYGIEVPVHAEKTPEGFIKVGDCVLYYTPAKNAERLEEQGRRAIDERTSPEASASIMRQQADDLGPVGQGSVTPDLNWSQTRTDVTQG